MRLLTVCAGTFNSNIGNASTVCPRPLPEDYKGSFAERLLNAIESGKYDSIVNSDKDKAANALYEVITGEGAGAGNGDERLLMLGKDMITRMNTVRDQYAHALEVFGEISGSVAIEGKA